MLKFFILDIMKMKFFYALLCAGAMCLASCGSSRTATTADLSGDWNVVAVNGNDVVLTDDAEQPYLSFDTANGQISGMAGCNRVMGGFAVAAPADGKLSLGQMGATRMMCPDMSLEDSILKACGEVASFKTGENGNLELCNAAGQTVMTLSRR